MDYFHELLFLFGFHETSWHDDVGNSLASCRDWLRPWSINPQNRVDIYGGIAGTQIKLF
jgi:hypothetical protein